MKIYFIELMDSYYLDELKKDNEIINNIEEADIVITRNLTIDKAFIDKAVHLKCIAIHGTGISEVDINYAKTKGIVVFNCPYQNYESVAEYSLYFALMAARQNKMELYKKKALVLGNGHIGKRLKDILSDGLLMDVDIYKRNDDIKDKLKDKDFVFICMSLNDSTYHFINKETISYMKKGVILINTARGKIVSEADIIDALRDNHILCYLTDVFEEEPLKEDNPLIKEKNVIYSPHIASNTKEALANIGKLLVEQINDFKLGNNPKHEL
ncbi:glycerate dehydrogenase [Anaeroplasma bactoclasticum]|jgi:phosphoglycerate dehydrogenase-like enzyme|uniref:Glycerate dehydrogenase n=1 Tax=Anaeroplasma bactoclasticum TaxID=2088 RepID=A0A397S117_9MOLU|nr:D-isomer specific 2-hydroxyacid dehydrogenase family protein [Anaeroplasma bactoclasticum]RIA78389.1 glycerate dehydrogenase [Anaeroplasma bactoclasticum]